MSGNNEVGQLKDAISALHQDCQDLANFIVSARTEIAEIRPNDLQEDKLPRAGKELDAIVEATETATNQIMAAAEKIMSAKVTDPDVVNDACMEIFEACSFQDITGQRISKVVSTLEYIEEYMTKLTKAWGYEATDEHANRPKEVENDDDASLLNGPALNGEGVDQNFVDQMFDKEPDATTSSNSEPKKDKSPASSAQDEIDALFD
ncbi:protein phosphatase CheZ [Sneathiella marina]|uniref:Protein phosphatase CheZ n=1 Tax=Sneathiella marina TaxID=2950108 RepID=A0ABY4W543_9PROT|nr:protein phosphatase CheZ [Sneathiella marina]USG62122.1 protein phosphatase CheZ [Sneathiella marina]